MNEGGNANTTISYPWRDDWKMLWDNGGFDNFQLDIVGFLAVLGEGSVTANSQVSALSPLFYLPRILPAPQALLPPNRPDKLKAFPGTVTAVHSGNVKDHVHHVPHVLLGDEMPLFTVRCVAIEKIIDPVKRAKRIGTGFSSFDRAIKKFNSFFHSQPDKSEQPERPVTANATGPLSLVTLLGFSLSITLFIASILFGDGMSMVATILLSFLSTLTGVANKSKLKLPKKPEGSAPPGDTVIRYPNGSFLIVKCDETIARELFFAPEEIEYQLSSPTKYRYVSLIGTVVLMLGIIALANAKLQLQFAWAGAYIIINAAHWIAAALPQKMHWDLSCYTLSEQGIEGGPTSGNFTDALWKAIVVTKDTRWVKNGKAAPQTRVWDEWLVEAETQAKLVGAVDNEQIHDIIFPEVRPTSLGRVWKLPKKWDAREEWRKINQPSEAAAATGAIPPSEAP